MDFHDHIKASLWQPLSMYQPNDHSSKRILMGMQPLPAPSFCQNHVVMTDVQQAGVDGDRWVVEKDGLLSHSAAEHSDCS